MDLTLNIEEFERFISSKNFIQFILNNTTDLSIAAFIIQVLRDKVEELKTQN